MHNPTQKIVCAVTVVVATCFVGNARADVVVVNNRTTATQLVECAQPGESSIVLSLDPGDSRPLFCDQPIRATYATLRGAVTKPLDPNTIHYLASHAELGVQLRKVELGEGAAAPPVRDWPPEGRVARLPNDVPVLLCVDDEEPTRDHVWQRRLELRIEKASAVLREHCGSGLKIIGYERWVSSNDRPEFAATIAEFEQEVSPPEGAIAIGFTSQHHLAAHRRRIGGTRGPLRRHLLLREWSPHLGEAERLEVLVHELGHYFGAAHSPEMTSVMRPTLTNHGTRLKTHDTRFDALNTLAVATLAEERRRRGATSLNQVSPIALRRLDQIYDTLHSALPHDPGAAAMAQRFDRFSQQFTATNRFTSASLTRVIISQAQKTQAEINGDVQMSEVVREAARAVSNPEDRSERERFLMVLGLVVDDTDTLANHPRMLEQAQSLDPIETRVRRRRLGARLTARGRADTAKHFFASAALAAASSENEALLWGVGKEVLDAQGGSGFSFADLAADKAGVRFARGVLDGSLPLAMLAERFEVNHFVPPLEGFQEGLQSEAFTRHYGGMQDARYLGELQRIDRSIESLPPYLRLEAP